MERSTELSVVDRKAQDTTIKLKVKTLGPIIFEIEVKFNSSISDVKKAICEICKDNFDNHRGPHSELFFNGKQLEGGKTIRGYGIVDGSLLNILFRLDRTLSFDEIKKIDLSGYIQVVLEDDVGEQVVIKEVNPHGSVYDLRCVIRDNASGGTLSGRTKSTEAMYCSLKLGNHYLEDAASLSECGIDYGSILKINCDLNKCLGRMGMKHLSRYYPHGGNIVTLDLGLESHFGISPFTVRNIDTAKMTLNAFRTEVLVPLLLCNLPSSAEGSIDEGSIDEETRKKVLEIAYSYKLNCGPKKLEDGSRTLKDYGIRNAFTIRMSGVPKEKIDGFTIFSPTRLRN